MTQEARRIRLKSNKGSLPPPPSARSSWAWSLSAADYRHQSIFPSFFSDMFDKMADKLNSNW
jgi:hypothetical protein